MKLSSIHQIEITSRCNLACIYCVHRIMKRKKEDMNLVTFQKALDLVKYFWRKQSQHELWLHGLGESLMHPDFLSYCVIARKTLPGLDIRVSSNAEILKKEHIDVMADLGIKLHISMHNPAKLREAPRLANEAGILEFIGCNPVTNANDWAGQVEWNKLKPEYPCDWLRIGWGLIYANGDLTSCCVDAEGDGKLGNINQPIDELAELEVKRFSLCKNCNLISENLDDYPVLNS